MSKTKQRFQSAFDLGRKDYLQGYKMRYTSRHPQYKSYKDGYLMERKKMREAVDTAE